MMEELHVYYGDFSYGQVKGRCVIRSLSSDRLCMLSVNAFTSVVEVVLHACSLNLTVMLSR